MSFDATADYVPDNPSFEEGIGQYLGLLEDLGRTKRLDNGWFVGTPADEHDLSGFDPLEDGQTTYEHFLARYKSSGYEGQPPKMPPDAFADEPGPYLERCYSVQYKWSVPEWNRANVPPSLPAAKPLCEARVAFPLPHPKWGMEPGPLIEVVKALVAFRAAQHVALYFWSYRTEHWPVDITRRAIGWIGWVPFPLTQRDVPEAARVEALGRGSLIVTNEAYWTPHENPEALARAQAVDRRLNLLGVLPTADDLARGDWGQ
ncbi:hypothetical protein FHY55_10585 [Oceanicola sp. D3]|uniref:Imm52 family immunity protein n=1 Tax=Oceanicola sp. D3 TaxID=2587163 RepID=UPI00111D9466|nr:Imm52 family immunity protein [Oceanicola sp. D3]QDC09662.1 hypothetical protein FHY55_10585 [Oceanicola sp. D3]